MAKHRMELHLVEGSNCLRKVDQAPLTCLTCELPIAPAFNIWQWQKQVPLERRKEQGKEPGKAMSHDIVSTFVLAKPDM